MRTRLVHINTILPAIPYKEFDRDKVWDDLVLLYRITALRFKDSSDRIEDARGQKKRKQKHDFDFDFE